MICEQIYWDTLPGWSIRASALNSWATLAPVFPSPVADPQGGGACSGWSIGVQCKNQSYNALVPRSALVSWRNPKGGGLWLPFWNNGRIKNENAPSLVIEAGVLTGRLWKSLLHAQPYWNLYNWKIQRYKCSLDHLASLGDSQRPWWSFRRCSCQDIRN